jgi:hypothetical protein
MVEWVLVVSSRGGSAALPLFTALIDLAIDADRDDCQGILPANEEYRPAGRVPVEAMEDGVRGVGRGTFVGCVSYEPLSWDAGG